MVDLNVEMTELWSALGAPPAGRPHVVQFVAARRGEGTSTVAREFARFAARRAGRKTAIPFGPWMILGAWTGVFAGESIGSAYLSLYTGS